MLRAAIAALWGTWTIYLVVQAIRSKDINARIGYVLGAGLSATTSYLLVT